MQKNTELILWVANKLEMLRKEAGYTSYENFAFDNDLPRVQYWRLEKGKADFRISSLKTVLEKLDIQLKDFFSDCPY